MNLDHHLARMGPAELPPITELEVDTPGPPSEPRPRTVDPKVAEVRAELSTDTIHSPRIRVGRNESEAGK